MTQQSHLTQKIHSRLKGGDILLIVPPITAVKSPLMGVQILQALAKEMGFKADILYLNVLLTPEIGYEHTDFFSYPPFEIVPSMFHERLFARSAYGLPPLGNNPEYCDDEAMSISGGPEHHTMFYTQRSSPREKYLEIENTCFQFVEEVTRAIAAFGYKIIGCTQREGQVNCTIALLNRIKALQPDAVTITGGSYCKLEHARGIASLSGAIDYIFSGESEQSFRDFLTGFSRGELPGQQIIPGSPAREIDSLPVPEYDDFINQTGSFRDKEALKQISLIYESSRGCWWGEKHECLFCSEDNAFRQKSSEKTLEQLTQICKKYKPNGIFMSDVSMPLSYHREVFPALLDDLYREEHPPGFYYQAKTNLGLRELITLKKARVEQFTVGIEALSDGLLKLMNKGIPARQNLLFMRNARAVGLHLDWLMLWGFPGDKAQYYRETLELFPLIQHLQPPYTLMHIFLTRFSPYHMQPEKYNITNMRPWAVYDMIFPQWADKKNLANWFIADYPCEAHDNPELMETLTQELAQWKETWKTTHLFMAPFNNDFVIFDNRKIIGGKQTPLDAEKAKAIMTPAPYDESPHLQWALQEKFGLLIDSWYIPLVTAPPEVMLHLEENTPQTAASQKEQLSAITVTPAENKKIANKK